MPGMAFAYPVGYIVPLVRPNGEETMNVAKVDPGTCDRSPHCPAWRACAAGAVMRTDERGPWRVNWELCTGCGACVRACPARAISMIASEES